MFWERKSMHCVLTQGDGANVGQIKLAHAQWSRANLQTLRMVCSRIRISGLPFVL